MTRDEIRIVLASILEEVVGLDADAVTEDKVFVDDLDVDSLSMVEVFVALEEQLNIDFPDEEIQGLATVGDALTWIEKIWLEKTRTEQAHA